MTKIAISNLASENTFSELNLSDQEKINGGLQLSFSDPDTGNTEFEFEFDANLSFDDQAIVNFNAPEQNCPEK